MRMPVYVCSLAALALSGLLALPALAQQSGSDSGQSSSSESSQQQSQQPPPAHKSAAQENPFPADVSKRAAQQDGQSKSSPDGVNPPAAPDADQQAPEPAQKPGDAAKENPFPEDVSKSAAAAAAKDSNAAGDSSSSSSSSSSDSSSSSNPGGDTDPNADLPPDNGRRKLKKPSEKDIQSGSLAGQGKAQDDVNVGRYYLGTGDYKGAYGRFSEAARLDPASPGAIYGLAAAAAGLHHTDEALTNYELYLQIAPDGSDAKSARKALRELAK
ncbi:MAG TPA: tetratricopeptide repeat protein [Acidobacteriaceae bacterium]